MRRGISRGRNGGRVGRPADRGAIWTLACVLLVVGFGVGCGGPREVERESEESTAEFVGDPPSERDDPFRVAETPETAKPAESTGYIGGEGEGDEEGKADREAESGTAPPAGKNRCHACVRICPMRDGGGAECEGERDVICGWGVHADPEMARQLARAECNGALEMAREMDQWSRIEGECPPAECRSP